MRQLWEAELSSSMLAFSQLSTPPLTDLLQVACLIRMRCKPRDADTEGAGFKIKMAVRNERLISEKKGRKSILKYGVTGGFFRGITDC